MSVFTDYAEEKSVFREYAEKKSVFQEAAEKKSVFQEAAEEPRWKRALKWMGKSLAETVKESPYVKSIRGAAKIGSMQAEKETEKFRQASSIENPEERMKAIKETEGLKTPLIDPTDLIFAGTFGAKMGAKLGIKGAIQGASKEILSQASLGFSDIPEITKDMAKFFKTKAGQKRLKESENFIKQVIYRDKANIEHATFEGIKKAGIPGQIKKRLISDWQKVKQILKTPGLELSQELNPYETRKLMFKKIQNQMEEVTERVSKIDKSIVSTAKELKIEDSGFKKDVLDYLHARHAPDYNAAHGVKAAGITDEEAAVFLKKIDESPHSDKIKEIAENIQNFHNETLDMLYSNGATYGVIDEDTYKLLKSKYKNHVPLQRIIDDQEIVEGLTGTGLDVRGSGLKYAKGSEREVKDILENIYTARLQAVNRIEKNVVDNSTYSMVKDFMRSFPDQDVFDIVVPPKVKTMTGIIKTEKITDPSILQFQLNGKPTFIKINDPELAVALKGVNRDKVPEAIKYIGSVTRWISKMATKHPEFAFSNKIRDMQEAIIFMAAQKEIKGKDVARMLFKDPASLKNIRDYTKGKTTEGAKLYKRLRDLGGAGGGFSTSTKSQTAKEMTKIVKQNRSRPRQFLSKSIDALNNWNLMFEDSTRLSAFKRALDSGISEKKAALIAKNVSIDFDEMGTWGPVVNSLYVFANASLQGTAKNFRVLIKNPKVAAATVAAIGGAVFAGNEWNDSIDPEWRKKISPYDRMNGFNIVLPTDDFRYITVPTAIALKPIKIAMEYGSDIMNNENTDIKDATEKIISSMIEGYSPISGDSLGQALSPSFARPFVDVYANRSYSGQKLHPDTDPYAPESIQYYPFIEESLMGKGLVKATEKLAEKGIEISPADVQYVIQQGIGGMGRFVEKGVETGVSIVSGDIPKPKNIPFSSRFLRQTESDYYRDEEENRLIKKEMGEYSRKNFYQNKAIRSLSETDANIWDYLEEIDPFDVDKTAKKLEKIVLQKGIPDKGWYNKLAAFPPKVREIVFEHRYDKSPPEIQDKMRTAAALTPGFLSKGFFESKARRQIDESRP
jgi:hypothetical protein